MEQRGQAAGPFSSPPPEVEVPAARLQAWARRAAELGALPVLPTQDNAAA
jgi:hypothetical protein